MTSEQTMLTRFALSIVAALLAGCAQKPELVAPAVLTSPYDTSRGEVLWAVVPLRNESGSSLADSHAISDKIVAAAAQVRGVRVLPLNRTMAAMRALKMKELTGPGDARQLAAELGADGILVGSITAYDPYDPPVLGLSLALIARPGSMDRAGADLDTRVLAAQPADYNPFPRSAYREPPASVVAAHLDAKNHQVLMDLKRYAEGRHNPQTALGWRRYVVSMDLFSEFAAWHAVGRLLDQEWLRLSRVDDREPAVR
jgi:hypothetical protein